MRIEELLETDRPFLTDGGLETYMIFEKGFDLPCFSAASLLDTSRGRDALTEYMESFIHLAAKADRGFLLDVPTWRAGLAWAEQLGLTDEEVLQVNFKATQFAKSLRDNHERSGSPIIVNGLIGPSGDAYAPGMVPTGEEAFAIHAPQIRALGEAGVDMVSAMTITHASEAVGIVRAAKEIDVPVAIGFTLETDGRLPSGQSLADAISEVDSDTQGGPIYFLINCVHPDHFHDVIERDQNWVSRIGGLRTNASRKSHAELDASEELDSGDPVELADLHRPLLQLLPNVKVLGGCCGTDKRHVACLAKVHQSSLFPIQ